MAYMITKKVSGTDGEQILIYPTRESDEIYDYKTLTEAQQKLSLIQDLPIYADCILEIIENEEWILS
jgi:hypothetical protein